jgi:hypothetical protein
MKYINRTQTKSRDFYNGGKHLKDPTPLDDSFEYPLKTVPSGSLLAKRIDEIRELLKKELEVEDVYLGLWGSQRKGRSSSGSPDIDIIAYHPDLPNDAVFHDKVRRIGWKLPFKLDLGWGDRLFEYIKNGQAITV